MFHGKELLRQSHHKSIITNTQASSFIRLILFDSCHYSHELCQLDAHSGAYTRLV